MRDQARVPHGAGRCSPSPRGYPHNLWSKFINFGVAPGIDCLSIVGLVAGCTRVARGRLGVDHTDQYDNG